MSAEGMDVEGKRDPQTSELHPRTERDQKGLSLHPLRECEGGTEAGQAPTARAILELRGLGLIPEQFSQNGCR